MIERPRKGTERKITAVEQKTSSLYEPQEIEKRFSEQLTSKEFIAQIREFPEQQRDIAIGCAVQYLILFPDSDDIAGYLNELKSIRLEPDHVHNEHTVKYNLEKAKLLVKRAETRIFGTSYLGERNLTRGNLEELERIYTWFRKDYLEDGYVFHGFNGVFERSIREHGIIPTPKNWTWEEVERIRDIFQKLHSTYLYNVLGWTSKGRVHFTDYLSILYRYAAMSPEWFGFFAAEGGHYHRYVGKRHTLKHESAMRFKDYESARSNIERLCDEASSPDGQRITPEEKKEVLRFFEFYWGILIRESPGPRLALIKRTAIKPGEGYMEFPYDLSLKDYLASHSRYGPPKEQTIDHAISALLQPKQLNSYRLTAVPSDALLILNLPEYRQVHTNRKLAVHV